MAGDIISKITQTDNETITDALSFLHTRVTRDLFYMQKFIKKI